MRDNLKRFCRGALIFGYWIAAIALVLGIALFVLAIFALIEPSFSQVRATIQ